MLEAVLVCCAARGDVLHSGYSFHERATGSGVRDGPARGVEECPCSWVVRDRAKDGGSAVTCQVKPVRSLHKQGCDVTRSTDPVRPEAAPQRSSHLQGEFKIGNYFCSSPDHPL